LAGTEPDAAVEARIQELMREGWDRYQARTVACYEAYGEPHGPP
jgi:hypothetical protein